MKEYIMPIDDTAFDWDEMFVGVVRKQEELVRCKDCKHRPIFIDDANGFRRYFFPDDRCPGQCDDWWYNWMPEDEWFCANGERKEE